MARFVEYAVVRLEASPWRGERLNVALIVFNEDGVDIRFARRLDKVRAISAAMDVESFRANILALAELDSNFRSGGLISAHDRRDSLVDLGYASLSGIQQFECPSSNFYEISLNKLLEMMVEPEPAILRTVRKKSKLLSVVKKAFKNEGVLGRPGDDLANHQLVPEVELAEGLVADFVLKNGAIHVLETVDASDEAASPSRAVKEIALSALIFEQARIIYSNSETKARLLYDASSSVERLATPSLRAAEHQGAELINWRSLDDRNKLIVRMSELAIPSDVPARKGSPRFISSSQSRLKLN